MVTILIMHSLAGYVQDHMTALNAMQWTMQWKPLLREAQARQPLWQRPSHRQRPWSTWGSPCRSRNTWWSPWKSWQMNDQHCSLQVSDSLSRTTLTVVLKLASRSSKPTSHKVTRTVVDLEDTKGTPKTSTPTITRDSRPTMFKASSSNSLLLCHRPCIRQTLHSLLFLHVCNLLITSLHHLPCTPTSWCHKLKSLPWQQEYMMDKIDELNVVQRNYLYEYLDLRQDITILDLDNLDLQRTSNPILSGGSEGGFVLTKNLQTAELLGRASQTRFAHISFFVPRFESVGWVCW